MLIKLFMSICNNNDIVCWWLAVLTVYSNKYFLWDYSNWSCVVCLLFFFVCSNEQFTFWDTRFCHHRQNVQNIPQSLFFRITTHLTFQFNLQMKIIVTFWFVNKDSLKIEKKNLTKNTDMVLSSTLTQV